MFRGILMFMLGRLGRAMLSFLEQNSLAFGSIVMLYGVVLVYSHSNLRGVMRQIEQVIMDCAQALGGKPDPRQVHEQFVQRWKAEQAGRRLFLPSAKDFWFGSLNVAELPELLHIGTDYIRVTLYKATRWPPREAFHPVDYEVWEEYRHRLLIGVRIKLPNIEQLKAYRRQQQQKRAEQQAARRQKKK